MIILEPHNPEWITLYNNEKKLLDTALNELNPFIEHIGSTAISTICAKPVIDIMLGVTDLEKDAKYLITQITSLGYEYLCSLEEHIPYRRFFLKNNSNGARMYQIHAVQYTSEFWRRHLLFRDYLKSSPDTAKQYEKLKVKLATQFSNSNEYALAKTEFIRKIEKEALNMTVASTHRN